MTLKEDINIRYFEWMCDILCHNRFSKKVSRIKLLDCLHSIEFQYSIPNDENRAKDGIALRFRYAVVNDCEGAEDYIDGPCSVLEMMLALAFRCEECIMGDLEHGDRTAQWFWEMIASLGLGSMNDSNFDQDYVEEVILDFMNRDYASNGKGGLFTVRGCKYDMRDLEIWLQLNEYLKTII